MTGPQFFGALVRAIGVYLPTQGLSYFISACFDSREYPASLYVVLGATHMVIGIVLMFQADNVVEMCYSKSQLREAANDAGEARQEPGT